MLSRTVPKMMLVWAVSALSWGRLDGAFLQNIPVTVTQPDGQTLNLFATGDEYYHRLHDGKGYTVIQDPRSGYYVYARKARGDLLPSSARPAEGQDPEALGLPRHATPDPDRLAGPQEMFPSPPERANTPTSGTVNNLVVFVRFSDESEFTDAIDGYESMFNGTAPSDNSMRNFFLETSYNALDVHSTFYPVPGATVVSFQDSHPRSYYQPYNAATNPGGYTEANRGDREQSLIKAAVDYIDSLGQVPGELAIDADNDGKMDNICFIVYGANGYMGYLLWPHKWSLYLYTASVNGKQVYDYNFQIQSKTLALGTGVLCHEMFHSLGAPDLYHYVFNGISPAGGWDLMQANANPPQHMLMEMKWHYGHWLASVPQITAPGTYTLNPVTFATNNCYKIASPYSATEYFMVEYRKRNSTFENSVPNEGLIVCRVDSTATGNAYGPPDELYVYRPDGTTTANGSDNLANFSSDSGRTAINDLSNPSSFLGDGSVGGLDISDVTAASATISFKVALRYLIKGTIKASGSPLSGVVLNGLPGNPATDSSGSYAVPVDYGWSGTVTPILSGYAFTPPQTVYSEVKANQTTNYSATGQVTIGGTVTVSGSPLAGVVMSGLPGSPATNASGDYSATVSTGWSGTVTPTLANYTFSPAQTVYHPVLANQTTHYTATRTFSISGTVTSAGSPLAGVTLSGLPGNPATDSSGAYSAVVASGWSGTVTPTRAGYLFSPAQTAYSSVGANQTTNYAATKSYLVSFQVESHGSLTGSTSQTVASGSDCTPVTAVADSGYAFVNWTGTGGFVTTTANPLTVGNVTSAMTITAHFFTTNHIPTTERAALIALYNSTSGDGWYDHTGWKTPPLSSDGFALPGSEYAWFGVTCDSENTTVTRLDLSGNNLQGTLPVQLGDLTSLTSLDANYNSLTGSIPASLGNLGQLAALSFSGNRLTGNIPSALGNLGNLSELQLGGNLLSGSIPGALGNLADLTILYLGSNRLTGSIPPELGNLGNLEQLQLGGNQLSGTIPTSLGNLSHLFYLDCGWNQLTGAIPSSLGSAASLRSLDLSSNQLSGCIPGELGHLAKLEALFLSNNQLTSIPAELGNCTSMLYIFLQNNQLTGSIPAQLGQLSRLVWLMLDNNSLSGSLPAELGDLGQLTVLHINYNQLGGAIPPELADLGLLESLQLHGNLLSGAIPPELGDLDRLTDLDLSSNHLEGSIPAAMANMDQLGGLNLDDNLLSGTIPAGLGNMTGLYQLQLGHNQLTGTIPGELAGLVNLQYLSLSENELAGTIPGWLGGQENLQALELDGNHFTGSIPANLGNLYNLWILFLDHNQLSGEIPSSLGSLSNLQYLYLDDNQLTGSIPSSLGDLANLTDLGLRSNRLSGNIPPALGNLAFLQYLYLDGNQLGGDIPASLGNLTSLQHLYLNGNQLGGSIPTGLQNLNFLEAGKLDIRWNALHTTNSSLRTFLNGRQYGGDWESTQTVAPANVGANPLAASSLSVSWTPISYTGDTGGYQVHCAQTSGGPYTLSGTTADKSVSSLTVTGLSPDTKYYFIVKTVTGPHTGNQNTVTSEASAEACATTTSACTPPSVTTAPASRSLCPGSSATLRVTASGTSPHYAWYQGESGHTGSPAPGGTDSPEYRTPALRIDKSYWVRVFNACGSADSEAAILTQSVATAITREPPSMAVPKGASAVLEVEAAGESLTYQWYSGCSGDESYLLAGARGPQLVTAPLNGLGRFWVKVRGACGSADSATALVLVGADLDLDGKVSGQDMALLGQYLADDLPAGAVFDPAAADINGDGRVDILDLALLSLVAR